MTHSRLCALALAAVASLTACPRPRPSGVAGVVGADLTSQLPRDLFAFIDILPANVNGFGYVDFGATLNVAIDLGPDGKPLLDDLMEMAQRRWGIDARRARGFGVAMIGQDAVVIGDVGQVKELPSSPTFSTAQVGAFTVGGKPSVVAAFVAAKPELAKTRLPWIKSALSHAVGKSAFFTFAAEGLPAPSSPDDAQLMGALAWATVAIGKDGGAAYATAKPGQAGVLRGPLDKALTEAKEAIGQAIQAPVRGPSDLLLQLAARHYGTALLRSLKVDTQGDVVSIVLPWHAPAFPQRQPTAALSQRVVAPSEWAVAQLDFGNPMVQLLITATDVLASGLARNDLVGELVAQGARALDLPAMDPRGATVSVGGMSGLISIYGAKPAIQAGVFSALGGELRGAATPWGYVVTPANMVGTLEEALDNPATGMSLAQSSRFANSPDASFRLFVDLTRTPMMAKVMLTDVPVLTVEAMATTTRFDMDVVTKPGQAAAVQQLIALGKNAIAAQLGTKYQDRKKLPASEELTAIVMHHQLQTVNKLLTPKVTGDRLSFSYEVGQQTQNAMWAGAFAGALAGAVAYFTISESPPQGPAPAPAAIAQ